MREMKDSGVAWIGKIPETWDIKTIRNLLIERNEKNRELSVKTILSLSAKSGVTLYSSENHSGNKPREDLSDYKIVRENDIVVNSMNILSGSVGLSKYTGVVSPVYYIYYPREKNSVQYLHFIFQCFEFQRSLRGLGNGILIKETESGSLNTIRMRIPSKKLSLQEFPSPPIDEQKKIAAHLDLKCTQIDALISNAQQQIEKLKAYKQSVITETVTKGLDPDVPMKDSGVEWIGEIPEHWRFTKTLNCLSMQITDGPHTTPELFEDGIVFISAEAVSCGNGKIDFSHKRGYISQEFYEECCQKYVPEINDIYMIKSGATTGRVSIVETLEPKFTIWSPLAVFRCNLKMMMPKYLFYYLQSIGFQKQVELGWTYGTQQNIGMRTLEQLKVCVPTTDEQQQISDYLDRKCTQIDKLIALKQQKIEKLQQYKKSLIYEYVTGKKEV